MNLLTTIALGLLALGASRIVYKRLTKEQHLQDLIGKRVRLGYYDHNVNFEEILPRVGTVISRHSTEKVNDWFLLRLDETFVYRNQEHQHLLIRSKWAGSVIGRDKQTAVFILLIPNMELLSVPTIDIDKFEHVAWGFVDVLGEK